MHGLGLTFDAYCDVFAFTGDGHQTYKSHRLSNSTRSYSPPIGMTLYRLSQDGLVRREGRTWFFVPSQAAETKNPGGDTPGLIEMLK